MKPSAIPAAPAPTAPGAGRSRAGRVWAGRSWAAWGRAAWGRALREVLFVGVLFLAYKVGRLLVQGHVGEALANAQHVWDFERLAHLPSEAALQATLLSHTSWIRVANSFYAYVHFPATAATMIWLYLRRPEIYLWFRRTLASMTALALVIHALFPLAPPRMLTAAGIVDTGHVYGPSVYGSPSTDTLSNQYAAMPSLHVGWALAVAIALIAASRSRRRWLWLAHPFATLTVVVVTGNHYWLDAIAAVTLVAVVLAVVPPLTRQAAVSAPEGSDVKAGSPVPTPSPWPVAAGLAAIAMPSAVPLLQVAAGRAVAGPASVGGHPMVAWKLADDRRPLARRCRADVQEPIAGRSRPDAQRPEAGGNRADGSRSRAGRRDPSEPVTSGPAMVAPSATGLPSPGPARAVPGQRTVAMAELADSSRVPVTTCTPRERIGGDPLTRPPGERTATRPGPSAPRSRNPHSR
ncbi:phosphatase PAP2 family protein [Paractinoplanes rhizophilus]|uniref:Phosphatase PAP2 family protein n=1 Tax=Paractinoplanes rhizophilus TaxID=1416877 RepID=A0ABW2I0K0_9ACTN